MLQFEENLLLEQQEQENLIDTLANSLLINNNNQNTFLRKKLKSVIRNIEKTGCDYIPKDNIQLENLDGSNNISKSLIQSGKYNVNDIIIKWVKYTPERRKLILAEINNLKKFQNHANDFPVVKFYGITIDIINEPFSSESDGDDDCLVEEVIVIGIILEKAPHGSIDQYLFRHPTTSFDHRLKWCIKLCQIISIFHEMNFVHRDMKPHNILLFNDDEIKLCDLELSQIIEDEMKTITYVGTRNYSAPETYRKLIDDQDKGQYSFHSEIYSLGLTLTNIFTNTLCPLDISKTNFINLSIDYAINENIIPQSQMKEIKNMLLSCIDDLPSKRMPIKEIINKLLSLQSELANLIPQNIHKHLEIGDSLKVENKEIKELINLSDPEINISDCLEIHQLAASQGNSRAQYNLGVIYHKGLFGVNKDISLAMEWYQKTLDSDKNNKYANYNLGYIYLFGESDGNPDYLKATQYFLEAADQGDSNANHQLGYIYHQGGYGVEKNVAQAKEWYQMAIDCDMNNKYANHNLGYIYYYGELDNVPNYEKAAEYYKKAADQKDSKALFKLGYIYHEGGYRIEQNISQAIEWYQKAIDLDNNINANYNLGFIYFYGELDKKKNFSNAVEYFTKAANQSHAKAQYQLGILNYHGDNYGISKNIELAVEWFEKSSQNDNDRNTNSFLGDIYRRGDLNGTIDYAKALEYYLKASEKNHSYAQAYIGTLYNKGGSGITKNVLLAVEWFQKAIENDNHIFANYNLAWIYRNGDLDNVKNNKLAVKHYEQAADQGFSQAQFQLGTIYEKGGHGIEINFEKAKHYYELAANNIRGPLDKAKQALLKLQKKSNYITPNSSSH